MVDMAQFETLKAAGASILAIDDEQRVLDSLVACLKPYPLQLDTALGGKEACLKLKQQKFDLVLLDLKLPDISGHEVLDFAAENNLNVPFIVISAVSSFNAVTKSLRRGVADYLKKPYSLDELLGTLANALHKRFLEKETLRLQHQLRESEQLHRYIVNSSPDIIFMLDKRGCITFINDQVENILGYQKAKLIGRPIAQLIDQQERQKAISYFHKGSAQASVGTSFELCLHRRGHAYLPRYFEITLSPVESGNVLSNYRNGAERSVVYGTARDITEQKEAEEFISFQAYHDTLTRLPNRVLFKDRLNLAISQAKRSQQCFAVMFMDLDRFKNVNDTLGHSIGDLLLEQVARRLEGLLRAGDTLSRFGGDEFTLLLPDLSSSLDAKRVAEKIIATLKEPFQIEGSDLYIGVSIGIALFPDSGKSIEQLIKNADQAMYRVKDRGKDGYCFYTPCMTEDLSRQVTLERDLRVAIDEGQFAVYYQPQVDIATGKVVGVEALIRWLHPTRGLICPDEFIGLAEETRFIATLGRYVMLTACAEVKQWMDVTGCRVQLAVNFSAVEMEAPNFADDISQILRNTEFPLELFEMELTEHSFMNGADDVAVKIGALVDMGVTVAIDDFGTGYSSLNYLDRLPVHTLKIDRTFVHTLNDTETASYVVQAIAAMAKGLRLNLIAEGVETQQQLNYVRDLGCHHAQGYHCGRPTSGDAILKMLKQQQDNEGSGVTLLA